MSGDEVKRILAENGYKLVDVAEKMGTIPQNLQGFLKVGDIKTGVLERIAKAIGKDVLFFFQETSKNTLSGHQSIAGQGNQLIAGNSGTISGNISITLPEKGFQKIIRSDGSQATVEVTNSYGDSESRDLAAENMALHKENSELKNKIIELQARLLDGR